MNQLLPLTRRELIALAGASATALILGEGILASETVNGPISLTGDGPSALSKTCANSSGDTSEAPSHNTGGNEGASPRRDADEAGQGSEGGSSDAPEGDATLQGDAPQHSTSFDSLPWNLRLISKNHPLPDDFSVSGLRELPDGHSVDERIYDDLTSFLKAAEKAHRKPVICSAYRTHKRQKELYRARVRQSKSEGKRGQEAKDDAAFWVAPPFASEHEAAIAVDLVDADYQELDEEQERTKTQKWLMSHCAEYGFILRYPTDKSAITGIGYEPWHYRYVGRETASDIAKSGLCFEEWLDQHLVASAE